MPKLIDDYVRQFNEDETEYSSEVLIGKATNFFDEVSIINDDKIRSATIKILNHFFTYFKMPKSVINHTKKVVLIAKTVAESRGYVGIAIDAIVCAAILHDLFKYEFGEFHPLYVRYVYKTYLDSVDPGFAEHICSMIEGHEGINTIIPKLAPKEGSIEQVLSDANALSYVL